MAANNQNQMLFSYDNNISL